MIYGLLWALAGMAQPPAEGHRQLLECIDSAAWLGLDSNAYRPAFLRSLDAAADGKEPAADQVADRQFKATALNFARDVWRGAGIEKMISYDGVSPAYADRDEDSLLVMLAAAGYGGLR